MGETIERIADCDIGFDPAAGALTMHWRGYGSSEAFRRANERILEALISGGTERILGDIEGLGQVSPTDQRWLSEDWIPRAIRAGLRRVALVTPAFDLEHAPLLLVGEHVAPSIDLAYFDEVEPARAWLGSD